MNLSSILARLLLSLPFLAVAAENGAMLGRYNIHARHQEIAVRSEGHLQKRFSNSKWTWYTGQTGSRGACGEWVIDSEPTVAMNHFQFKESDCFKTITLSRGGVTRQAKITDMCPQCPFGGLDLTPTLFAAFEDQGTGSVYDGVWDYGGQIVQKPKITMSSEKAVPSSTKPALIKATSSTTIHRSSTSLASSTRKLAPSSSFSSSSIASRSSPISSASNARATANATSETPGTLETLNQVILEFASVAVNAVIAA